MALMEGISTGLQGANAISGMLGLGDGRQLRQQKALTGIQLNAQKELGKFNAEQALMMWKNTGAAAQVKELEKAGLSKSLMMAKGGGPTGQTTGGEAGSVTGGTAETPSASLMAQTQAAQAMANIELTKAQAKQANAEADKTKGVDTDLTKATISSVLTGIENTKAQTIGNNLDNDFKETQNLIMSSTADSQISKIMSEAEYSQNQVTYLLGQIENSNLDYEIKEKSKNDIIKNYDLQNQTLAKDLLLKDSQIGLNEQQAEQLSHAIIQAYQGLNLTEQQIKQDWGKAKLQMITALKTNLVNAESSIKNALIGAAASVEGSDKIQKGMIGSAGVGAASKGAGNAIDLVLKRGVRIKGFGFR